MAILSESPDVIFKRIFYYWNAIKTDPDHNKFFDTAVAGSVDFLITNDAHFKNAKNLKFPFIRIINSDEFLKKILEL